MKGKVVETIFINDSDATVDKLIVWLQSLPPNTPVPSDITFAYSYEKEKFLVLSLEDL
jgi:hypothetical protein